MANLGTLLGGNYSEPSLKKEKEVPAILKPRPQVSQKTTDVVENISEKFAPDDLIKFLLDQSENTTNTENSSDEKTKKAKVRPQQKLRKIDSIDKS